jgi:ubiquinone/menaquinone biosynthesis C-methylase UbiE
MTHSKKTNTSWDDESGKWYQDCVGEKGHYYHETLILQGAVRLLELKAGDTFLDLGCGQGVLERALPKTIHYVGVDSSKTLIAHAKKQSKAHFIVGDVCQNLALEENHFDAASFILSLQNMERPDLAIKTAARHLKVGGKLLMILNHPCFRIPRQSHWGVDPATQIQYRRMDLYMSPQKIPIQTHPGKKDTVHTYSFHNPLSNFVKWCAENNLSIAQMDEWCSDKQSQGGKAKMENRARKEFPLFLAILAVKQ